VSCIDVFYCSLCLVCSKSGYTLCLLISFNMLFQSEKSKRIMACAQEQRKGYVEEKNARRVVLPTLSET